MSRPDRPLRLLAYTDTAMIGGAERSLATLLTELDGLHRTVVAVDPEVSAWFAAQCPVVDVELVAPIAGKRDLGPIREHLSVFRRLRPDVAHINLQWLWTGQYGTAAALMTRGTRVAVVEHAAPVATADPLQRQLKRALSRRVDAHVAVAERSARLVETHVGLPAGSVQTIHNGVPPLPTVPSARRAGSGPVIGTIGRIDEAKGFGDLLQALVRRPDASLVIVGDGPQRSELIERAKGLGVAGRIEMTGWTDEPRGRLPSFDVFALPSRLESFPLTIVEAMLAEVAVVATDVGGVTEAVADGETGLVVPPNDPAVLCDAVVSLLDDPERRARLAQAGRVRAERDFTAATMAERYLALYEALLR